MKDEIKNLIRPHYRDLAGYVSAGMAGKDANRVYLNANENPYEVPGLEGMNRYPEPQPPELLRAYAEAYDVAPEQILATRGSDEAIALLTRVFCEPHRDKIAIHSPTFGIYAVNAAAMPVDIADVPLVETDGTFALNVETLKNAAAKIIYLCSPNNPTGTSFAATNILDICTAVRGKSIVVLDEAYIEFSQNESLTSALDDHPNLIVLRTLSKAYALAGARMGCMIAADTDFVTLMKEKVSETYPIPKPCVQAALTALGYDGLQETVNRILGERLRVEEALADIPAVDHVYESDTNFLLIKMQNAKAFVDHAKDNNVLIRDFSSKPGLENCLRLSIGTTEENDLVLSLLKEFAHP